MGMPGEKRQGMPYRRESTIGSVGLAGLWAMNVPRVPDASEVETGDRGKSKCGRD